MPSSDDRDRPPIALISEYDDMVVISLYGGAEPPLLDSSVGRTIDVLSWSLDHPPWTPREFEADAGLQYNVASSYDPIVGAWATEDPDDLSAGNVSRKRHLADKSPGTAEPGPSPAVAS